MNNRISVATIDSPEFVNITSMSNPLISKCEVKVLYVGENRNRSYITKDVALEMAKTLPGCPIVGYFVENKEDFGDHGDQVIIDGEGVKFNKLTKPYGFVAPDSKIWFQKFEDTDEFGNKTIREYLMTEGYLWTGQYEEAKKVIESGNPQSMELDEKTLKGHWSTDYNKGIDFFIINDAIFSKLCILGEDVEPCFEGANITAPKISSSFSKNDDFSLTLFSMIEELKNTLNEGGLSMENLNTPVVEETQQVEGAAEVEFAAEQVENLSNGMDNLVETASAEIENTVEEFAKKDEEKEEQKNEEEKSNSDSKSEEKSDSKEEPEKEDDEDKKKKYSLLEEEYNALQEKYSLLEAEVAELKNFKLEVENTKKDELISSFYMLSDEDKADVITNKAQYSLEDIEAKLSVICVRKKVNFNLEDEVVEKQPEVVTTFNLNSIEAEDVPAFIGALRDTQRNSN